MKFNNKQEQYEWWTAAISKIQNHDKSIRQGCREVGVQFWQYYEWKERVQQFVDEGKVTLPSDEAVRVPRGPKSKSRQTQGLSFIEITNSTLPTTQPLTLHFKNGWHVEIPEGFNPSTLTSVLNTVESL